MKADGTITSWGYNANGQTNVPAGLSNVVAIAAGDFGNLALRSDGTVTAWGQAPVPAGLSNVVAIAAGGLHNLALKVDGAIFAWGDNSHGQTTIPSGLSNVVAIAAGDYHSLALKADGTAIAWGQYLAGSGFVTARVPSDLVKVAAIAAGSDHNLALIGSGAPTVKVPLISPGLSGNHFAISLQTESGRLFALEYKDSLVEDTWKPLPLIAGNGGMQTLTDHKTLVTQRFYRVRRW